MSHTTYDVHFSTINSKHEIVNKVKEFKTDAARTTYLDKLQENGTLNEVLSFSDPS